MKIKLNLLPKNRKKKIENKKILKLFIWQEGMLIFSILLLFGIAVGMSEIINIRMKSAEALVADSLGGNYVEIKKYEDALSDIKTDIKVINKVQKNNINWIPIFQKINDSIPEGILVSSISNQEYKVVMIGVAKDRDQLIEMKSNIENNSCFKEVLIPINNIVLKDNIDFRIEFKIEKNCLIQYEK